MHRRPPSIRATAAALAAHALALAALVSGAAAQELLRESFDATGANGGSGVPNLEAQGWIVVDQSFGTVASGWRQGPSTYPLNFQPHEGTGFLGLFGSSSDFGNQQIARWLILPDLGLAGGEEVALWLNDNLQGSWPLAELRLSPSGGTATGSGPLDVGDFTTLLAQEVYVSNTWKEVRAVLPGPGRVALRLHASASGPTFFGVGVDELVVSATPTQPPLPAPGQTVHWTAAMSPIVIDQEWSLLSTGTVVIEAGVEVVFAQAGKLRVQGNLVAAGTAAVPVRFRADPSATEAVSIAVGWYDSEPDGLVPPATADLRHVESQVCTSGFFGASIAARDSSFAPPALTEVAIHCSASTLALERCAVSGARLVLSETFLQLEACDFDGARIEHDRRHVATPTAIDGCTLRNVPDDAPLIVTSGNDVFLGPQNVIANNLYPIRLDGGGIRPGSTVPTSGNLNDYVRGGDKGSEGDTSLGAIAVPYRLHHLGGNVEVEPGTRLLMEPDADIRLRSMNLLGTPDAPIVVDAADPSVGWGRIYDLSTSERPKVESVHARNAECGAQVANGGMFVFDSVFEQCAIGARATIQFGRLYVERSRFVNNAIGLEATKGTFNWAYVDSGDLYAAYPHNPNWIEGNGVGAFKPWAGPESILDARFNWWGDPSGPQHPANPGGQGDSADSTVQVLPFLQSPPDFDDHPPVVRFQPMSPYLWDGKKLILHWTATDDGSIVAQRLEYTPHANNPPLVVTVPKIAPGARSLEVTVPDYIPSSNIAASVWRIVAVDDAGQEGWSEYEFHHIPPAEPLVLSPDLSGGVSVGQRYELSWQPPQSGTLYIDLDDVPEPKADVSLGYALQGQLSLTAHDVPPVSTDLARYRLHRAFSSHDHAHWKSGYFEIRPHALAGDAPPQVSLLAPQAGDVHSGGDVVPVRWSASDDRALRSFDLQASYDGGYTWHVVVRDLPPTATSYDWQLPSSTGIPGVELRVIARDDRFQVSSDGTGRSFDVLPGGRDRFRLPGPIPKKGHQ